MIGTSEISNFPLYFRVDVLFTSLDVLAGELKELDRTIEAVLDGGEALLERTIDAVLEGGEAVVPFAGIVDTLLVLG